MIELKQLELKEQIALFLAMTVFEVIALFLAMTTKEQTVQVSDTTMLKVDI